METMIHSLLRSIRNLGQFLERHNKPDRMLWGGKKYCMCGLKRPDYKHPGRQPCRCSDG